MDSKTAHIRADVPITVVSDESVSSVHAYDAICPECPDGSRLTWFKFLRGLVGPGEVMVSDPDGKDSRVVARASTAIPHTGAFQHWIDNDTLVYNDIREDRAVATFGHHPNFTRDAKHVYASGTREKHSPGMKVKGKTGVSALCSPEPE
jgi:hypothetical protein